jgi:catechol 2,3-dioxygenase-like lactoylglutathione lyase family enzyme
MVVFSFSFIIFLAVPRSCSVAFAMMRAHRCAGFLFIGATGNRAYAFHFSQLHACIDASPSGARRDELVGMILKIDHTALSVPDLERALDFYCGLLGFEIELQSEWHAGNHLNDTVIGVAETAAKTALLRAGGTRIELFEYKNPLGKTPDRLRPLWDHGIAHLCFNVADIYAEYERLRAAGIIFNSAPVQMGRWHFVYGRDPFGNLFELKQRDAV